MPVFLWSWKGVDQGTLCLAEETVVHVVAGLSAWDKHVAYRNIRIYPAINPADAAENHSDHQVSLYLLFHPMCLDRHVPCAASCHPPR